VERLEVCSARPGGDSHGSPGGPGPPGAGLPGSRPPRVPPRLVHPRLGKPGKGLRSPNGHARLWRVPGKARGLSGRPSRLGA